MMTYKCEIKQIESFNLNVVNIVDYSLNYYYFGFINLCYFSQSDKSAQYSITCLNKHIKTPASNNFKVLKRSQRSELFSRELVLLKPKLNTQINQLIKEN